MKKRRPAKKLAKKSAPKRASKNSKQPELRVGKDIWPLERDILFRPDRFKYVRKLVKPEGCVFCVPAQGEPNFENLCLYQTEHSMVVLNKYPYNSGHIMILPRRHCGDLLQLSAEEYADLSDLLRLSMRAVNELYQPGGMNIGMNHGATAGAGIPAHLHYHLVPRWSGDLNFFPLIAETKLVIEPLEQSWDRLRSWFVTEERSR